MKNLYTTLAVAMFSYSSYAQTNTFPTSGNVGIGTTSPTEKLVVSGGDIVVGTNADNQFIKAPFAGGAIRIRTNLATIDRGISLGLIGNDHTSFNPYLNIIDNGYVGIGTTSPNAVLHVSGTIITGGNNANIDPAITSLNPTYLANSGQMLTAWNRTAGGGETDFMSNSAGGSPGGFAFYNYSNSGIESQLMWIQGNGNVTIGTTNPHGYKLAVNGDAIATSMTVKLYSAWPDYVFKPTYKLPTLTEVKTYIDQNQHLPEMPSAQEIVKNGVNLGDMIKLQAKKIEELTLYLIEQDKRIKELEKQHK